LGNRGGTEKNASLERYMYRRNGNDFQANQKIPKEKHGQEGEGQVHSRTAGTISRSVGTQRKAFRELNAAEGAGQKGGGGDEKPNAQ